MAGLNEMPTAMQQLAAIRYLRGRLFWNAFRRKGGKAEIVARTILFPLFAVLALIPIVGSGVLSYFIFTGQMKSTYYPWLLWAVFLIWQSLSISTKAAAPSFDLGMLIRFPLRFSTYLLIRLLFGLLDTPTVVCSSASGSIQSSRPGRCRRAASTMARMPARRRCASCTRKPGLPRIWSRSSPKRQTGIITIYPTI